MGGEGVSKESVQSARFDDDDDDVYQLKSCYFKTRK